MKLRLALTFVALVPTVATAQRRGGGGGRSDGGMQGMQGMQPMPSRPSGAAMKAPSGSDLEKQSPVRFLLDKKKKLSLADSQVTQLEALAAKQKAEDATLYTRADSLHRAPSPPSGSYAELSEDDRNKLIAWRLAFGDIMDSVRVHHRTAMEQGMAVLSEDQRVKAMQLFEEQRQEERRLRSVGEDQQDLGKGYQAPSRRRP